MTQSPLPATCWEAVQHDGKLVYKHENTDSFCMDFKNSENTRSRALVTAQELRHDFGEYTNEKKGARTEKILRAIFETYIEYFGHPPETITFRDIGPHQELAKARFLLMQEHSI